MQFGYENLALHLFPWLGLGSAEAFVIASYFLAPHKSSNFDSYSSIRPRSSEPSYRVSAVLLSYSTKMAPILPSLLARQVVTTTPVTTTRCNNISGGDIAGIVIGTIFGTLLIAYLISRVRSESYTPRPEPPRRRRRRSMDSRAYVSDDARSYRVSSVRAPSIREPTRVVYAKSERL